MSPTPPLLVILGTTASGKSDLAITLAERLGHAEIVSADSRQVYRGLDLGTGKVTAAERARIPHHLLDVADVRGPRFTVGTYQALAFQAIKEIQARGNLPIFVGGTGLYVRAVVDNTEFPSVAPDLELRATLEAQPLEELVVRLRTVDPAGAEQLDLKNPRRVVRALEVSLVTGVPFSQHRLAHPPRAPRVDALQLGLTWPRDVLRQRINTRVDDRLEATPSMLDEVRGLLDEGVSPARLMELGLEYRFLTRHLIGEVAYAPMVEALKTAIYQFSRRQLTWFRPDARIRWLEPTGDLVEAALAEIGAWQRDRVGR